MKNKSYLRLAGVIFALMTFVSGGFAEHSDEETIKLTSTSKYNLITGNWDVRLAMEPEAIAEEFENHLETLAYHLVDESKDNGKVELTFRGEGDQRVVVKLKDYGKETNVRMRVGLTGNESKSLQLFSYVYKRM